MKRINVAEIESDFESLPISRDRDQFLRELIRELSGALEDIVGIDEASGFISVVGGRIGDMMSREYKGHLQVNRLSLEQVSSALVDLKRRIKGEFSIESIDAGKIVFVNRACPFGEYVKGRPSLCMMTSNVFGRIAAENLGYSKVILDKTIAQGDPGCRVVLYLTPDDNAPSVEGREYYATSE